MKPAFSLQKLTTLGLLTALSLIIYVFESLLVPIVPIPGIKPGLANVITLITLKRQGPREAGIVLLCRILLASFFFGQALSFFYSLSGGFFCLLVMSLCHFLLGRNYLPINSIMGAIAHNLAQLATAMLLTKSIAVISYLPFLMISAIITGAFTGLCAHFALRALPSSAS